MGSIVAIIVKAAIKYVMYGVLNMNKFLMLLLGQAMKKASPAIVANLREMVQNMVERAAETENPWDDIIMNLLQLLVGKPGSNLDESEET